MIERVKWLGFVRPGAEFHLFREGSDLSVCRDVARFGTITRTQCKTADVPSCQKCEGAK